MTKNFLFLLFVSLFASLNGQEIEERITQLEAGFLEHYYSNLDSTNLYFKQLEKIYLEQDDYSGQISLVNIFCNAAGYHLDLDILKNNIDKLDSLIIIHANVLDTLPDKGAYEKNYLAYNKGNYYSELEDYPKSQFYFEEIIRRITSKSDYQNRQGDIDFLFTCYSFIAQINSVQHRFQVASEYYEKNIRLYSETRPNDIPGLHSVYNLYAGSLFDQKKFDEAKNYWAKTLDYAEKNYAPSSRNSIVTTSMLLSKTYTELGKTDSANFYLNKFKKYEIPEDPFAYRYFSTQAAILQGEKKYEAAITAFDKAIQLAPNSQKPDIRQKMGNLYTQKGAPKLALEQYQMALIALAPNFDSKGYSENPDPNQTTQKQVLLRLLKAKANALNALETLEDKRRAHATVTMAVRTLDSLKPGFKNEKDKTFLIENAFPAFETGLEALFALYSDSKKPADISNAFYLFEKSKGVVLLEALLSARAQTFSQVPTQLLEAEKELKSKIAIHEKRIDQGSDDTHILQDELFDLKNRYRKLLETLENDYRPYYNLKYNTAVQNLADFKNNLLPGELVASYFYGNKAIYVIGITNETTTFHKVAITPALTDKIVMIRSMAQDPQSDIGQLAQYGYDLYTTLLQPLIQNKTFETIKIMPDGPLNYLPFELLNTKEHALRYLIEQSAVSYVNSATLAQELNKKASKNGKLMAFAPTFKGTNVVPGETRNTLQPLPNNKKEVETIQSFFEGTVFIDKEASLQNFTDQLNGFNVLHLATHGNFNDTIPEYSYLAFSPDPAKSYLLYVKDIYNLELNADMVTLSACETGIGELKRGEGFLSLARAFFYSGAKSITSTLWKVNDASSAEVMGDYYEQLANGLSKDRALRTAKRTFLEKNSQNGLRHPYYWAGYVVSGNTKPLGKKGNWYGWGLGGALLLVGGIVYYRKKRA